MKNKPFEDYLPIILLLPSLLLVVIFFAIPIWSIVRMSFSTSEIASTSFTLKHYFRFLADSFYLKTFWVQLKLAIVTTLLTFLTGYPVAYLISITQGVKRVVFLLLTIFPMWTSLLVRIYGWVVLLVPSGVINQWLINLHLLQTPLPLVFNFFGMTVGTMQYSVPFMILTCFTVLDSVDPSLEEAARDLGASGFRTFWEITLPLSGPGIVVGLILAFMWGMGAFLAPDLMGSAKETVMSIEAGNQIYSVFNWSFGAAICFLMFVTTCIGIFLIVKIFSRFKVAI